MTGRCFIDVSGCEMQHCRSYIASSSCSAVERKLTETRLLEDVVHDD